MAAWCVPPAAETAVASTGWRCSPGPVPSRFGSLGSMTFQPNASVRADSSSFEKVLSHAHGPIMTQIWGVTDAGLPDLATLVVDRSCKLVSDVL